MVDVTELAHWRYRVKALTADVDEYSRILEKAKQVDSATYGYLGNELGQYVVDMTGKVEDLLTASAYLLEEARYMVELGELTLT